MYSKLNPNLGVIIGAQGKYDTSVQNLNVRYGRNAMDSFKNEYLENYTQPIVHLPDMKNLNQLSEDEFNKKMDEFDSAIKKMDENEEKRSPLNFVFQYTPSREKQAHAQAVLGAAYEEMDKKTSISTQEMTQNLQETADALVGKNKVQMSAESLDINKDGQIDVGEYASSILVSDKLSNNGEIKGIINAKGLDSTLAYGNKKNYEIASQQYKAMYDMYNLQAEAKNFASNPNNLV